MITSLLCYLALGLITSGAVLTASKQTRQRTPTAHLVIGSILTVVLWPVVVMFLLNVVFYEIHRELRKK